MNGYAFTVTCGRCGSTAFAHSNGCEHNGTESIAVCRCVGCGREYSVVVLLRPLERYKTEADYKAERRERVSA